MNTTTAALQATVTDLRVWVELAAAAHAKAETTYMTALNNRAAADRRAATPAEKGRLTRTLKARRAELNAAATAYVYLTNLAGLDA